MPTIRERIICLAQGALETDPDDGGPSKPAGLTIHRERTRAIEVDTLPAVLLYFKDDEPKPIGSQREAPLTERRMVLTVESRAIGSPTLSPDEALDPVYLWTVYRLLKNERFGGLANGIEEGKTEWHSKEGDLALASATTYFTIRYRTSRIDPSSKG
jgi:hypothetical protein